MTRECFSPVLVHEFLQRSARLHPAKTALVFQDLRISYAELDRKSSELAAFLLERGLQHQDRIIIFSDNCAEAIIALYGVLKAGCIFVLLNGSIKPPKLAYIINDSGARWIIAEDSKAAVVQEALTASEAEASIQWIRRGNASSVSEQYPQYEWNQAFEPAATRSTLQLKRRILDVDLAALIYTSGSTGEPKGVMSTHGNMVSAARSIAQYLRNTQDDVVLTCLPLSFDYGLYQVIMAVMYSGTVVLEKSFLFIHEILTRIASERVTGFPLVPTILAMLLKLKDLSKYDLSSLRYFSNTGAALPVEHIIRIRKLLPHIDFYSMFGLTECKRVCYLPPEEIDKRPGSVGIAMPNCETFILDENGNEVPPGEVGELVIRGQNVMQGYWNAPELTARTYRPGRYPGERFLYSGDLFKQDADGFLYFVGRKGEMIKSRGERISPKELEDTLCRMDGVAEAAVIGVPDELLGEAVKAFVVPVPGTKLSGNDVLKYCRDSMESFMVPKSVEVLDALPKSPNGKIDKRALKSGE